MFHDLVQNPILSVFMAVLLTLLGTAMIVPPSKVGIDDLWILDPIVAQEDDHWLIRVGKGTLGVNFLTSAYMWVGPPLVIETDLSEYKAWTGSTSISGLSWGPFIWIHNELTEASRERVLRHEYQHYCQFAVLTPLGMWGVNAIEFAYLYIKHEGDSRQIYLNQWCEKNAKKHQYDGLQFNYILWSSDGWTFVRPTLQVEF